MKLKVLKCKNKKYNSKSETAKDPFSSKIGTRVMAFFMVFPTTSHFEMCFQKGAAQLSRYDAAQRQLGRVKVAGAVGDMRAQFAESSIDTCNFITKLRVVHESSKMSLRFQATRSPERLELIGGFPWYAR